MRKLLMALATSVLLFCAEGVRAQSNLVPGTRLRLPPPGLGLTPDNKAFIDQALVAASTRAGAGRIAAQQTKSRAVRAAAEAITADPQKLRTS